ncbi:hypothetical protein SERLA73DRAFT_88092 [Serpula lacrymans var. lacrymans S7.3]|uniref:Sugar phosphate transporter domain-containing protein n=2 Tax=Serpula lacrymans var. lacrymans TaxID=341189 RepID=F8PTX1_SERL3|nr:uncharacterized protein SERLADRAFT_355572 [Serpula lacrymans var. lacrymans S7.9]EGN99596.1 hypothetical protein SERLA73DRAFT_88092 [Serpula lacrymans var. lacrymans S7.3]EGO25164.1 hypothetical protein SERLADRAFT_355572 [Serpula lacrymans var. lacrymans S7.9]
MAPAHNLGPDADTLESAEYQPIHRTNDDQEHEEDVPPAHIASFAEKKRIWWRNAAINALFIASWFLFATVLSVYNKWMFSPEHFGFPFPLFVTTLHMIVQFLLAASIRALFPRTFRPERSPTMADYGKKAVPTAITTGLDIGLSNLSLKTITLSFYTMCKSSSLVFVLLFAFLFRLEVYSFRLIGVILLIFGGVLLMVATETSFVLSGFILVLTASALGGLRWSLTQLLLKNKTMGMDNPAATVYWLAPMMGVTLAVISAIWEGWGNVFKSSYFHDTASSLNTALFLVSPGFLAFCMVLSEFYIIQRAGVVPMSIAGIAKEVTTITISAWFFGDELTPLNITGVGITVCGIALFTYHKYRKSVDSNVALDAHGNPIPIRNDINGDFSVNDYDGVELETDIRRDDRSAPHRDDQLVNQHLLFSADDLEEGEEDAEEVRSVRSSKIRWIAQDGNMEGRRESNEESTVHQY